MYRILMFMGLCAIWCQTSCTSKPQQKEEVGKYAVTTPLKIDTSFTKEYVAQIKSVKNIEIRALEKGYLEKIYVDEGQAVKAGQSLFRITPKMYQAEYEKAEAEAKEAEIELQNTQMLADKNIVSKNELAVAKAKVDQAKAEMAQAKFHVTATEIKAPFAGIIDRIPLKLGSLVDEGELLTSLSDNNQVYAYFNVSEPEYLDYEQNVKNRGNNQVGLLLANGEQFKDKGEVETVESEFDSETGNIAFRARFPNADRLLKNGETGKVLMTVPLKDALIIPQKATYEIQDKIYVFVVGNNHVVRSQPITIKGEMPDLYVIQSGLAENDKIIIEGVQKVKDDDKIDYEFQKPADVMSHLRFKAD